MNSVRELWKQPYYNKQSSVEWWDSMAEDFSRHQIPTPENSLTMRIIERERMLSDNCSILDVGCGAGRFSIALARRGARVFGTDISPKMISSARSAAKGLSDVSFSVDDWHTLDLKSKEWSKSFDLVLANMTPAVSSADTFQKLTEASKKWCVFVKPSRRVNSVLDSLNKIVGAPIDQNVLDETIVKAFELLWRGGFYPKLEYTPEVWHSKKPLEDAVFQYTKRIESLHDLNDKQRKAIREYLFSREKDGYVEETTTMTIVAMYWRT